MKIAIDYDGTLMVFPEIYKQLIQALRTAGHKVGIITGRPGQYMAEDTKRIAAMGIIYDFYYVAGSCLSRCEFDTLEEKMIESAEWNIHVNRDDAICLWKARMCVLNNIDILFDDAADMILRFISKECKTIVFKSPTEQNRLLPKWGKGEYIQYS